MLHCLTTPIPPLGRWTQAQTTTQPMIWPTYPSTLSTKGQTKYS
ncbi:hypothetical protein LINPERHAP1_LOCUS23330 [Linum perenne]